MASLRSQILFVSSGPVLGSILARSLEDIGVQANIEVRVPASPSALLDSLPAPSELSGYSLALVDPELFPSDAVGGLYQSLSGGERVLLYLHRHSSSLPVVALSRWLAADPALATAVTNVAFDGFLATAFLASPSFTRADWHRLVERATNTRKFLAGHRGSDREMNRRDIFICHASEDKRDVVIPIVHALREAAVSYWYDEEQIAWGDSIIEAVNQGLAISRFVVVVLSQNAIGKPWPRKELSVALQSEIEDHQSKVLPLLVGDKKQQEGILSTIPLLRDKRYLVWEQNGERLVREVYRLLERQGNEVPVA